MKDFEWIHKPIERAKEYYISDTIMAYMLEQGLDPEEGIPWRYVCITNRPIKSYLHHPDEPWRQGNE